MESPNNKEQVNIVQSIKQFVYQTFDLNDDTDKQATIDDVKAGVVMRGQTAWVLVFSILVASVGLNTSSTAVVIGAMLISPLMGPILGMGLSLGVNDIDFLKRALTNFGIMVVLSLLTSFLFFSIPIFQDETPELLARTFPDVRDVIIAFSGGLALIVAMSRRNKSTNTIAGVAIATALMPPLCTAGYGLAVANWNFFFGALFLFSINTIFIASATFLVVRFLNFPYETYANSKRRKTISRVISLIAIVILLPSVYLFYTLYQSSKFESAVNAITNNLRTEKGVVILDVIQDFSEKSVSFAVVGRSITNEEIKGLKLEMENAGFSGCDFKVLQNVDNMETLSKIEEIQTSFVSTQQLLVKKEEELLKKDRELLALENQLNHKKSIDFPFEATAKELKALEPSVKEISYAEMMRFNFELNKKDTLPVFKLVWLENTKGKEKNRSVKKLENWLRTKFKNDSIKVVSAN